MTFIEKLDRLMDQHGLNKNTLSKGSGIPYTTIDGWYKKGDKDVKLSSLKSLSKFFGITLDYWAFDDMEEPIPINQPAKEKPSPAIAAEPGINEIEFKLFCDFMENIGFIKKGQDITAEQLTILLSVINILEVTFPNHREADATRHHVG